MFIFGLVLTETVSANKHTLDDVTAAFYLFIPPPKLKSSDRLIMCVTSTLSHLYRQWFSAWPSGRGPCSRIFSPSRQNSLTYISLATWCLQSTVLTLFESFPQTIPASSLLWCLWWCYINSTVPYWWMIMQPRYYHQWIFFEAQRCSVHLENSPCNVPTAPCLPA